MLAWCDVTVHQFLVRYEYTAVLLTDTVEVTVLSLFFEQNFHFLGVVTPATLLGVRCIKCVLCLFCQNGPFSRKKGLFFLIK